MSKLKTHKSAQKRIKRKVGSRFQAQNMSAQHRTTGKSARTKRASRQTKLLSKAETNKIKKLLPYVK